MAKKTKKNPNLQSKQEESVLPAVEILFKRLLKIMSWVVGICFTLIITLPNFEFSMLDITIKIIFYIGVLTLLIFIVIELFGDHIKTQLSKTISNRTTA